MCRSRRTSQYKSKRHLRLIPQSWSFQTIYFSIYSAHITSYSFIHLKDSPIVYLITRPRKFAAMPLNYKGIYPSSDPEFTSFPSRRSVVHSTKGIVSSTQPLASNCGIRVLQQGGNCAVRFSSPSCCSIGISLALSHQTDSIARMQQ